MMEKVALTMKETTVLKSSTFENVCRTCLQSQDLFFIDEVQWEGVSLRKVLSNFISFEKNYENKMPQSICKSCAKYVYNIHYFQLQIKKSEETLQNSLVKVLTTQLIGIKKPVMPKVIIEMDHESKDPKRDLKMAAIYSKDLELESSTRSSHKKMMKLVPEKKNQVEVLPPELSSSTVAASVQTLPQIQDPSEERLQTIQQIQDPSERLIDEINKDKTEIQSILKKITAANKLRQMQMEWRALEQSGQIKSELDGNFSFYCGACEIGFNTYDELLMHKKISNHSKGCIYSCSYCKMKMKNREKYDRHMAVHENKKPCVCPTCRKGFFSKNDLYRHIKYIHLKHPKLKCKFCYRIFSKQEDLEEHEITHENISYICSVCGKSFKVHIQWYHHEKAHNKQTLPKKLEIQTGKTNEIQKYQCTECEVFFSKKENLDMHVNLEHKHIKYPCDICNKEFSSNDKMKNHKDFVHTVGKFVCDICGHTVKQKNILRDHIEKIHKGNREMFKMVCNHCDKSFYSKSSYRQHLRIHSNDTTYQCKICFKICTSKRALSTHTRVHTGERSHKCEYCEKKFAAKENLKKHLKTHTESPHYQCSLCERAFYANYELQRHIRKSHNSKETEVPNMPKSRTKNCDSVVTSDESCETDESSEELVNDNKDIQNLIFIKN